MSLYQDLANVDELGELIAELQELEMWDAFADHPLPIWTRPSRPSSAKICEARLYVGFVLRQQHEQAKPTLSGSVKCSVEVQGNVQSCHISASKRNGSHASCPELIFDVPEFYGMSSVKIVVCNNRLLRRATVLGTSEVTLREIASCNNKPFKMSDTLKEKRIGYLSRLYPSSDSTVYWGFEREIPLTDPLTGWTGLITMYGRYVPLRACQELRRIGGVEQTELHHAASRAPIHVVEDLLAALSREGVLADCLRIRCRSIPTAAAEDAYLSSWPAAKTEDMRRSGVLNSPVRDEQDLPGAVHLTLCDVIEKEISEDSIVVETIVDVDPDVVGLELTPLEAALQSANSPVAKVFLERAGNFCFDNIPPGQRCNTPIHSAVRGGVDSVRMVMRFLSLHGARQPWSLSIQDMLECRDKQGRTPLMLASLLGRTLLVNQFLKFAVNAAAASGDRPFMKTVSKYGNVVIASTSSCSSHIDGVRTNIGAQQPQPAVGSRSLMERALRNHIRSNRSSNEPVDNGDQWTALMYAAAAGASGVVQLFMKSPEMSDRTVHTASAVASMNCSPCARSKSGRTALMIAAEFGRRDVVELMIMSGVPMRSISTDHGESALHIAASSGHFEIVELFIIAESVHWNVEWGDLVMREKMRSNLEANLEASQFRRHLKDSNNVLNHMQPLHRFITALNFRGLDAQAIATKAGYPIIAALLKDAASAIYTKGRDDFLCIQDSTAVASDISDNGEDIFKDIEKAEHAAYLFALAVVPRKYPISSGNMGFMHMNLEDLKIPSEDPSTETTETNRTPTTV